jgi:O-methyltransferase
MAPSERFELPKSLFKYLASPRDPERGFRLLRAFGRVLAPGYKFQWPDVLWLHYPRFAEYLQRFNELDGLNSSRKWMLSELMRLVEGVPGDTAECGVFEGASSYLMCRANQRHRGEPRTHYVFDSFAGLSAPQAGLDGDYWKPHALSVAETVVRRNLAEFESVRFLQGWIPERFPEVEDRRFALVHIDVDLHDPTRDSLEFFYPRTNAGGIIVCDDYGSGYCPGATKAVDDFLADKPEKMLEMVGGGGFLIRGTPTQAPAFRD